MVVSAELRKRIALKLRAAWLSGRSFGLRECCARLEAVAASADRLEQGAVAGGRRKRPSAAPVSSRTRSSQEPVASRTRAKKRRS